MLLRTRVCSCVVLTTKLRLGCLFLVLAAAPPAFAWGCTGHQVIALIAQAQLNPHARQMVDSLLAVPGLDSRLHRFCSPTQLGAMAAASTWADDERDRDPSTKPWHFLDVPLNATRSQLSTFCDPAAGCLTSVIQRQLTVLRSAGTAREDKITALMFLIHFVGDLHQPLHVATNNDRGGNCLPVAFLRKRARLVNRNNDSYRPNLHSVWDTDIPERVGNVYRDDHDRAVQSFADALLRDYAASLRQWRRQRPDVDGWAWEAHQFALSEAYRRLPQPAAVETTPVAIQECSDDDRVSDRLAELHEHIGWTYIDAVAPVLREQLAKGGARLALLLNQLGP